MYFLEIHTDKYATPVQYTQNILQSSSHTQTHTHYKACYTHVNVLDWVGKIIV